MRSYLLMVFQSFVFFFFDNLTFNPFINHCYLSTVLPQIQPFNFGDKPLFLGESVTVQCSIYTGDIPVRFSWMLNGKPIDEMNGYNIGSFGKKTSVLAIDSVSEEHAGNYTCLTSNRAGLSSFSNELVVQGIEFKCLM